MILYILIILFSFEIVAENLEFVIVIPSYNNEKHCYKNLDSIMSQGTQIPYKVIYINDCSEDKTKFIVDDYVKNNNLQDRITVINNERRVGALENLYNVIHALPNDSVVILVDGDDCLAHNKVLDRVAYEYLKSDIWLTYGQYAYSSGNGIIPYTEMGVCALLPQEIIEKNLFRMHNWVTSHLRTFKAGLFKKIKKEDLLHEGSFYQMAWDIAIMMPMLEMSSKNHISFIPDVLYIYNWQNPISDHNVNRNYQANLCTEIYGKKLYAPLELL